MSHLSPMPSSNGGVTERSTSAAPDIPADSFAEPKSPVFSALNEALDVLGELDLKTGRDSEQLSSLKQRLAEGRFHLAVLGQFKRGKSTFLNALLREELLPVSVLPLTAIPTFIEAGPVRSVEVHFEEDRPPERWEFDRGQDASACLAQFVTEELNPKNRRGVRHVTVRHPASVLQHGAVLIDTPGIGSTFQHNTVATLNFLPQCDAAVFLVSADPPITDVELDFLRQVRGKVPRLFLVFNKTDYLAPEEIPKALAFFRDVIEKQVGWDGDMTVFPISARRGLEASRTGSPSAWADSGMAQVEQHLLGFLAREKAHVLESAIAAKTLDVLNQSLMRVELAIKSLQMPLEELQARQAEFRRVVEDAQREQRIARDLLAGERRRAVERLEEHSERLRSRTRSHLHRLVEERLSATPDPGAESAVQEDLAEAIPSLFERELGTTAADFTEYVARSLEPHWRRLKALIESVRKNAAELFEIPYRPLNVENAFVLGEEPYWETHAWQSRLAPIPPELVDRFLPARVRRARIAKRLMQQVDRLVMHNVERLRWPTLQSLDATFRRFGQELDDRFQETIAATQGAIEAAVRRHQDHTEIASGELARLTAATQRLGHIIAELERSDVSRVRPESCD